MNTLRKNRPGRALVVGALIASATLVPFFSIYRDTFAKEIKVSDLFEHSGFASEKLFRCALDAYKDANDMVSDKEVVGTSYEEWIGNGGQTFDANKIKNVKKIECVNFTADTSENFAEVNFLTGLGQFTGLEALRIVAREPLIDLQPISNLTSLKYLDLQPDIFDNTSFYVPSVHGIAGLTNLEQLALRGRVGTNIAEISNLSKLKRLSLYGYYDSPSVNHRLSDISFLSGLTNLETLDLRGNTIDDEDLSVLSNLSNLKYLALYANQGVSSDNPIFDSLTNLEYLDIRDEREGDMATTGDPSIHPKFNDGVLYKAVVDSYYRDHGDYPFVNNLFFDIEYDAAAHRKEVLTDAQLASIEHLANSDGSPDASKTPKLKDSTGLETMPNLKSIDFELMGVEDLDISNNTKLEKIYLFDSGLMDAIDFSHNPELKDVYLWQEVIFETLDFSKNPKLQRLTVWADKSTLKEINISNNPNLTQVTLMGAENAVIYITDTDNLENIYITGPTGDVPITTSTIKIVPPLSTRLVKTPGRGGDGDSEDVVDNEETFTLNLSNLKFIKNNNTAIEGELENETFTVKDPTCYRYDATSNSIIVKASCVADGLKSATITHKYTIAGTEYTNSFDISFNPVNVVRKYVLDGEVETFEKPLEEVTLYIGQDFDSSKYDKSFEGYTLKSVEASIVVSGSTKPVEAELFTTSTETKKLGALSNENTADLILTYNYESKDVKVPDTGFFTNEDGGLNVVNTLLVLAGLSVAGALGIYAYRRISGRVKAHRF